jgi:hypothetical protein
MFLLATRDANILLAGHTQQPNAMQYILHYLRGVLSVLLAAAAMSAIEPNFGAQGTNAIMAAAV